MAGPRKFLVVDEALAVTRRTRIHLEHAGIDRDHILEAFTGEGALELYEEHHPEVVVLALELPDATGHRVAKEILGQAPRARVVLCAAASRGDPRVQEAVQNGVHAVLRKPLNASDIRELLTMLEESPGRTRIPPSR